MKLRPFFLKTGKMFGIAAIAFGMTAAGAAFAGTSNESFHINYQGAVADVGHQTKAITGTSGYVRLSHNYPGPYKARFRMASGSTTWGWGSQLVAGQSSYLSNTAVKGRDVRMDVKMNGSFGSDKGTTLKGYWRSN